jgi:hypothetical protein
MKKLIFAGALAIITSGAFAQSSQSQGGAQAGTNGNATTAPSGTAMQNGMRSGTTGMNSGMKSSGPNGTANDRPTAKGGPAGQPSKDEAAPK